jgi:hypothetical protein
MIALFGEAERGQWEKPHLVRDLPALVDLLGNPPEESLGLFFAIQAIMYEREVLYFRVQEEGFSKTDYFFGLKTLKGKAYPIQGLCMPGVGDPEILDASTSICKIHNTHLIITEKDLYDYLSFRN